MNVTASPMPLVIDGTEYLITPLSDQATQNITMWLRGSLMKSAYMAEKEINKEGGNGAEFAKTIIQACLQVEWSDNNGTAVLRTDTGLARLLVESLKPTVAGITQNKAAELLKVEGAKGEFWDVFLAVNDLVQVSEDDSLKKKRDNSVQPEAGGTVQGTVDKQGGAAERPSKANPNPARRNSC